MPEFMNVLTEKGRFCPENLARMQLPAVFMEKPATGKLAAVGQCK